MDTVSAAGTVAVRVGVGVRVMVSGKVLQLALAVGVAEKTVAVGKGWRGGTESGSAWASRMGLRGWCAVK